MVKQKIKIYLYVGLALVLLAGAFGLGSYVGYNYRPYLEKVDTVVNKDSSLHTKIDFNTFWKAWNILNNKSIYANNISDQDRVWGAISGLASSFNDPYTVFFNPKENKSFNEEIKGSFEGIGAEIGVKDGVLTVISPLKDTPAFKAGIKTGDKILKIDNTITNDMSADKAISLIRGEKGTIVTLTILRQGEQLTREFKIERDNIDFPTIDSELRDDGIFVIRFYSFSENSSNLFKEAINKFIDTGSNKLILDLRGNPGGYLDSAISIGSLFVDQGKILVKENFKDNHKEKVYRSKGPRLFDENLKFIILVDGGSASASEILAGALREHGIATLVGEQTFGKGSVQELINITEDTSLKITVANWLTPEGISISESGLKPDIIIPITLSDIENKRDPQMEKAVEILLDK